MNARRLILIIALIALVTPMIGAANADFVTDHLYSYYNWTDDSGSTVVDNSGNGHNGTNSGSVLNNGPIATRMFDGTARIDVPHQPVIGWDGFTYEMIVWPTNVTPGTTHGIVGQGYGYNSLYLDGAKLVARIVNIGCYATEARTGNISTALPTHVVMAYNNTTKHARLYVNGTYVTQVQLSSAGSGGQIWKVFDEFLPSVGDRYIYVIGMGRLEGTMWYLRVYDTNLSDVQVQQNYQAERWRLSPIANFTSNVTTGTTPLTVQFWDNSTGSPTAWEWQWGDGSANSTEQNPVHTYDSAGTYTITLTASNSDGSSASRREVYINAIAPTLPVANFTANVTSGTAPLQVQFWDNSTNATSWQWQWGDGMANATERDPVHTYAGAGTYTVNLTAANANGSNTIQRTGYVTVSWAINTTVGFQASSYMVNENASAVTLTVIKTGTSACSVNYTTVNGTALAGMNYNATSGTLYFTDLETNKSFNVTIRDDYAHSSDRVFFVNLTSTSVTFDTARNASVTITDTDTAHPNGYAVGKRQNITGSTTGILNNHLINFTIHNGSGTDSGQHIYLNNQSLNWPYDVRFVNDSTGAYYEQWFEPGTNDSNNVTYWVLLPQVPAAPKNVTVRIYYGKANDTIRSNEGIWTRVDDFKTSFNSTRYRKKGGISISNSIVDMYKSGGVSTMIESDGIFSFGPGSILRAYFKGNPYTADGWFVGIGESSALASGCAYFRSNYTYSTPQLFGIRNLNHAGTANTTTSINSSTPGTNEWHIYEVAISSNKNQTQFFMDGIYKGKITTNLMTYTAFGLIAGSGSSASTDHLYLHWWTARNWSLDEPKHGGTSYITSEAGIVEFNQGSYTVNESAGSLTFNVRRSFGTDVACSVNYTTVNGTALAGVNYTATSGRLDFASGDVSKTFTVNITDDAIYSLDKTFNVRLTSTDASLGVNRNVSVTITEDDAPPLPLVQFNPSSYTIYENTGSVALSVTKTGAGSCSVNYTTTNGTALAGVNYTASSGELDFAADEMIRTITVNITNDTVSGIATAFYVNLTSTSGMFNQDSANRNVTVTIKDDDTRLNNSFVKRAGSYVINTHAHSNYSGGYFIPATLIQQHKNLGFDAAAITDYWGITADPGVSGITFLRGTEWESYTGNGQMFVHGDTVLVGVDLPIGSYQTARRYNTSTNYYRDWSDVRSFANLYDALVIFPHADSSNSWNYSTLSAVAQDYDLYEVCNGGTTQNMTAKVDPWLNQDNRLWLVSGSDTHGSASRYNWDMVNANDGSNTSIIEALRTGNFIAYHAYYGSRYMEQAFVKDITVSGMNITIYLMDTSTITWIGANGTTLKTETAKNGTYTASGAENYVRAYINYDYDYLMAWTQPIYVEPAGPIVKFNTSTYTPSYQARNADGNLTVQIIKMGTGACYVNYTTANGTALAGVNYVATSGQLVFNAAETSKMIEVPIIYSSAGSGNMFYLNITSASASYGNVRNATVAIQ